MLQWMAYVFIVTVILAVAALSAERALRLHRSMARWVWATAIVASLVVPTVIASISVQLPSITTPTAPRKTVALRDVTSLPLPLLTRIPVPPPGSRPGTTLDSQVKRCWVVVSSIMLLLIAASAIQLYWRMRRWRRAVVAGVPVYIAPGVGPAVAGLLRPRIVLPPWVVEATPSLQADVIAHEQAHLAARDPQLLAVALCLLVFMPWNLPLWWQLHRLRCAIEMDCDARVLRAGRDVVRYGESLVEVGARQSGFIGSVAAMSESRSFLEQRIKIMLGKPKGWWKTSATVLGCMSVCLIAVAAQVSPPNSGTSASNGQTQEVTSVDPAVYDGYVGHYKINDTSVMAVSRDGTRLLTRATGQSPVEIFPRSNTEYFFKAGGARLTFQTDAQGHATALTLRVSGMIIDAPRITDQAAQQIEDALNARVQSQAASPGSEVALRKLYAGLLTGTPNYDDMDPLLAKVTRQQLPRLEARAQQLGPIVSVEFLGVGTQGWDIYELHHEHGLSSWHILLASDGKVEGALYQGGP